MEPEYVYRISSEEEWSDARKANGLLGGKLDKDSGFVHLSTMEQVPGTLKLFFKGREDLLLLKINVKELGSSLKWESSGGGSEAFPHFYGSSGEHAPVPLTAIEETKKITFVGGQHDF